MAKGADCKSAGYAFVGSSPTSPTSQTVDKKRFYLSPNIPDKFDGLRTESAKNAYQRLEVTRLASNRGFGLSALNTFSVSHLGRVCRDRFVWRETLWR